jgi:hypothetical protein
MFGAEVSRVSGEPAPIPAYLTDKRLKIRISKLPEKVRERLYRKGYVGQKEIGVVKKEKSKLRHILGIEQGNIPIQLDLWGNEVIFRGKGQLTLYGYPR